jgi:hypothetical protein
MDEQIKLKVLEWLQALEAGAKSEIPAYCQEVVNWHIASNIVNLIVCLILGTIMVTFAWWIFTWLRDNCEFEGVKIEESNAFLNFGRNIIIVLFILIFGCSAQSYTTNIVKGYVAPRAVIIEHLRGTVEK